MNHKLSTNRLFLIGFFMIIALLTMLCIDLLLASIRAIG